MAKIDKIKVDNIEYDIGADYSNIDNTPTIPSALADLSEDTTHRVVTDTEKSTWNGKAEISDIPDVSDFITKDVNDLTYYTLATETGSTIELSINSSTYVMTMNLKNSDGTTISTQNVDLPLESVVVSGSYDSVNKKIVLTLQSGSTIDIPVGDLISGLQSEITSSNKLSSDLVDDTISINKFVTTAEKSVWNNKSDFSGDYNDLENKPTKSYNINLGKDILFFTNSGNGVNINSSTKQELIPVITSILQDIYDNQITNCVIYFNNYSVSGEGDQFISYMGTKPILTGSSFRFVFTRVGDGLNPAYRADTKGLIDIYSFMMSPTYSISNGVVSVTNLTFFGGYGRVLTTDNATSYIPTNDYNPSTKKYVDDNVATKQDIMQYSTMPTADSTTVGKIVQYIGVTDSTYTNGYFYIGTTDGESTPTYSWENLEVQASSGGGGDGDAYIVWSNTPLLQIQWNSAQELNVLKPVGWSFSQQVADYFKGILNTAFSNNKSLIILSSIRDYYANPVTLAKTSPITENQTKVYITFEPYMFRNESDTNYYVNSNKSIKMALPVLELSLTWTNGEITDVSKLPSWHIDNVEALTFDNTKAYTPTGDYNPSTKLYTDKTHYENMSGYDATKTQVLKNINGTLTWVDES